MARVGKFIGGLVLGAAIGAAVSIFTSPKSGDDTRASIGTRWQDALTSGRSAAKAREAELWAEFNTRVAEPSGTPMST